MQLLWLIALALGMSAVSLYYYLQVLKQVYVARRPEQAPGLTPSKATMLVVGALAITLVVLGCVPNLLLTPLELAIQTSGF